MSPTRLDARWLGILLAAVALPVCAQQQRRALPIHIQSNNANLSQKNGVSTYTGDVKLTRGGLTLTGDKLVVTRINDRNNIRAVLTGAPAHFNKQPDRDGKDVVTGHAQRIEYANNQSTITLRGQAVVDRGGDQVTGQIITHNLNSGRTQAKRGSAASSRVHITIMPQNKGSR